MRLRTLPLSLGGVLCGGLLAAGRYGGGGVALLLTALTACALQVLSNLSNELGDYRRGTDRADVRQGPAYSLLEGGLTESQMSAAIRGTSLFCCLSGLAMVWTSFGTVLAWQPLALLLLGGAAIWAAKHYTLGKNPYGYRGLGDLFVFIFFGLVSVAGSYFVVGHRLDFDCRVVMPAVGMGLLSVAVLNVNNIRDMESDRGNRVTTPLRLGERGAKWYQTALVVAGVGCFYCTGVLSLFCCTPGACDSSLCLSGVSGSSPCLSGMWPFLLWLLPLAFFVCHLAGVWRRSGRGLDPMLPMLVIATFLQALLYGWCWM